MISVIMAINDAEKYLRKTLDHIKDQSYSDFEVIMIDGGSKDSSADICREFERNDGRFHYYYQTNKGLGAARNAGLSRAAGEYLAFVDSDDLIDHDYLEVLAGQVKERKYSVVQSGIHVERNGTDTLLSPPPGEYDAGQYAELVLSRKIQVFSFQAMHGKMYDRELVVGNGLHFNEETVISEDCLFNTQMLLIAKDYVTTDYAGYHYITDNSVMTKAKRSFEGVRQSLLIGTETQKIRESVIQKYNLSSPSVTKGFQTGVCIVYLSNAAEIENNTFSKAEKEALYKTFMDEMDYPIDLAVGDFPITERKIIKACASNNSRLIGFIYKLRALKKKLRARH